MSYYAVTNMSGIKSHIRLYLGICSMLMHLKYPTLVNRMLNKTTIMEIVLIKQSQMIDKNKVN